VQVDAAEHAQLWALRGEKSLDSATGSDGPAGPKASQVVSSGSGGRRGAPSTAVTAVKKVDLKAGLGSSFVVGPGDWGDDARGQAAVAPPAVASTKSLGDAWMAEASLADAACGLAAEWAALLALAKSAVALEAARHEAAARAQSNPDQPVAG
jgi:hypothetical protein